MHRDDNSIVCNTSKLETTQIYIGYIFKSQDILILWKTINENERIAQISTNLEES